jgi:hypothetical protein
MGARMNSDLTLAQSEWLAEYYNHYIKERKGFYSLGQLLAHHLERRYGV